MRSARGAAKGAVCRSNLHSIGIGFAIYQNENRGKYPAKLEALIETADLQAEMFICPSGGGDSGERSYIYRGADLDDSVSAVMIVAYDRLDNH